MDISKTGTGRQRLTSKQRQRLLAKFHQSQFAASAARRMGKQRLLAKFHQSQLAQREFANQHAIGMSTLANGCGWNATPFSPR
jgi:hypothetical protein